MKASAAFLRSTPIIAAAVLLAGTPAHAAPTIVESGWTKIREIPFTSAQSARLNPKDGAIYVGTRVSSGGLYRVDAFGLETKLASANYVAGLAVAPNGDVFWSEDYDGYIYRIAYKTTTKQTWVNGFHTGDDDPTGMAIAPPGHTSALLKPGEAMVVDRGNSGLDEVWRWTPATAQGEVLVHSDKGTLVDAVDMAIDKVAIYVADQAGSSTGAIYTVGTGGALTKLTLGTAIADPSGIDVEAATGDLLVTDRTKGTLLRVNPKSGKVSTVISGFTFHGAAWAGVQITSNDKQLVITAQDKIYVFARCGVSPAGSAGDCDANGKLDTCDMAQGTALDCNDNGVLDSCDIKNATSTDCDNNKIPDECPVCSPVEAVFVMDHSTSMDDEAKALCGKLTAVTKALAAKGIKLTSTMLGISGTPGGAYSCLSNAVTKLFGTAVPLNPPANQTTLGSCPGGNEVASEDWGRATSVVAGKKAWKAGTIRMVVPVADEGPWCGDPASDPGKDRDSITHAIKVAKAYKTIVSPITGTGSSTAVKKLAADLAAGTGGQTIASTQPQNDMATAVLNIIKSACLTFSDCNKNGTPDDCDISLGKSKDCDLNKVPDECQTPAPTCIKPDAGVPDMSVPDMMLPDMMQPDAMLPDAPLPDAPLPDQMVPDLPVPDMPAPDMLVPDLLEPDLLVPDMPTPDQTVPDLMQPDLMQPDQTPPDAVLPDSSTPDTLAPLPPDKSLADLSKKLDAAPGDASVNEEGSGCGDCSTAGGTPPPLALLLLAAIALIRRRART